MDRIDYLKMIEQNQSEKTRKLIGEIDLNALTVKDVSSLYYIFPLIEKMITCIYSKYDIEFYDQGTKRTPISIFDRNFSLLPSKLEDDIRNIYDKDGVRNKVMHCSEKTIINVDKDSYYQVINELLVLMNNKEEITYKVIEKL